MLVTKAIRCSFFHARNSSWTRCVQYHTTIYPFCLASATPHFIFNFLIFWTLNTISSSDVLNVNISFSTGFTVIAHVLLSLWFVSHFFVSRIVWDTISIVRKFIGNFCRGTRADVDCFLYVIRFQNPLRKMGSYFPILFTVCTLSLDLPCIH
jgi:hypothetical protein